MSGGTLAAMAVNFGWPWWAFTTIAICVAVASVVLLALLHAPFVRGVLATLLLESVVIAALAPALMSRSTPNPNHNRSPMGMRRSR